MRNFMIDVWIWTKGKHSRPLKTIRFELDRFPTDEDCNYILDNDADVRFFKDEDTEISFTNLREYNVSR